MIPVDLNITSTVKSDDDEEKIEFFTVGQYAMTPDGAVITYEETEGIGYEDCEVSVKVCGSSITVERTGPAASTLCIEKNVKHHSIYGTPFGDFTMGINTYDIQNTLGEAGGRLWFKYSIDINSDFVSENEMEILVTPSGEEEMNNEQ